MITPAGPPARLEAGPKDGLEALPQDTCSRQWFGCRDPPGALFGCLGSRFYLLIKQEKAQRPNGASECHLNQPDLLRTGCSSPSLLCDIRIRGAGGHFNPVINSEKREPNGHWLNCFVSIRKKQSAVTQF